MSDRPRDVIVFGLSNFDCKAPKTEPFGPFLNPIIRPLIPAGARLDLEIVENILSRHGAVHAFCDPDSMGIPPLYKT